MGAQTDEFDLGSLRLAPGEGRRLSLEVSIAPLVLGSESYRAQPARVPVRPTIDSTSQRISVT